jgi:hypothetical protein
MDPMLCVSAAERSCTALRAVYIYPTHVPRKRKREGDRRFGEQGVWGGDVRGTPYNYARFHVFPLFHLMQG